MSSYLVKQLLCFSVVLGKNVVSDELYIAIQFDEGPKNSDKPIARKGTSLISSNFESKALIASASERICWCFDKKSRILASEP